MDVHILANLRQLQLTTRQEKELEVKLKAGDKIVILRYSMGITKTEIFTPEQNQLAVMLKAIAHPARLAILQRMISSNTCICGELVGELSLAQATVSQHLKELKNSGLIKGSIEGTSICYCIDPKAWKMLKVTLNGFFDSYKETQQDCC
jgi:DNA-binding transcriptional ArsR family regulator